RRPPPPGSGPGCRRPELIVALILAAQVDGALVLNGRAGADGLKAFLTTAGTHTRSLSPGAIGDLLRDTVGVDLLAEQAQWSLAKRGPRTRGIWRQYVGLLARPSKAKNARAAWTTW